MRMKITLSAGMGPNRDRAC